MFVAIRNIAIKNIAIKNGFAAPRLPAQLVCPEGIEPPTHSLEGCCSIQLSYGQSLIRNFRNYKENRPANQWIAGRVNWSEYKDSNLGPPGPKPGALPGCATLRSPYSTPRNHRFSYCCLPNRISRSFSPVIGLRSSVSTWQPRCTAGRFSRPSNQFLRCR
jgi:hypothetical protein